MYHMEATTALLADAAALENGKLYVHGAGWDQINAQAVPLVHPAMALVLVLRVGYDEAMRQIPFRIELLTEDDKPLGVGGQGVLAVGHAPTQAKGAPSSAPLVIPFTNVHFGEAGGYRFRVSSGDSEIVSVPFRVFLVPNPGQA
jgi:hypothetical protein